MEANMNVRIHHKGQVPYDAAIDYVSDGGDNIVQIMPAAGYAAVFYDEDAPDGEDKYLIEPIVAWALVHDYETLHNGSAQEITVVVGMVPSPDYPGLELAQGREYIGMVPTGDHSAAKAMVRRREALRRAEEAR